MLCQVMLQYQDSGGFEVVSVAGYYRSQETCWSLCMCVCVRVCVSKASATYISHFQSIKLDLLSLNSMEPVIYIVHFVHASELHKQGRDKEVEFEVSYTSKEEYLLDDLSAESWHQLVKR